MIDLHVHTHYSDGTNSVLDILREAEKAGLEALSITDHDTIEAYNELKNINIKDYYSGEFINGVEIKTIFKGIPIEILGYKINVDKFSKSKCIDIKRQIELQKKYLRNFIKIGKTLGIKCSPEIKINKNGDYAALKYCEDILKYKENFDIIPELLNEKIESFYRNTSGNKKSPFYIDETVDALPIDYVIDEIHKAGGLAFLAHLYIYKIDDPKQFLEEIIESTKLDGIECYYTRFKEHETKEILEIAEKYNMLKSGGTDFHGELKKDIKLGVGEGNLNIQYDTIKEWLDN